jgi:hypothetical protein
MAISRYQNRFLFDNIRSDKYNKQFSKRNVPFITQYSTPRMIYPSDKEFGSLITEVIRWKVGDSFAKLAYKHYDDPELWWVIAWFNKKPADFLVKIGDEILIPFPLEDVLSYYNF